jgi:hypothetical protein
MIDLRTRKIEVTEEEEAILHDYVKSHMRIIDGLRAEFVVNKIEVLEILGFWYPVFKACPDRRVAHLMMYGKNDRVKLKNYYHAIKLIGRELDG